MWKGITSRNPTGSGQSNGGTPVQLSHERQRTHTLNSYGRLHRRDKVTHFDEPRVLEAGTLEERAVLRPRPLARALPRDGARVRPPAGGCATASRGWARLPAGGCATTFLREGAPSRGRVRPGCRRRARPLAGGCATTSKATKACKAIS